MAAGHWIRYDVTQNVCLSLCACHAGLAGHQKRNGCLTHVAQCTCLALLQTVDAVWTADAVPMLPLKAGSTTVYINTKYI